MFTGKDIPAEKRWYVIGAHQAGASERQCARLSGLSKTAVHGIIKTFAETGSPLSNRQQLQGFPTNDKRKLSLEFGHDSIDMARRSSEDYEVVGISPEVFKRRKSSQVGDVGRIIHHTASKAHKPLADDDSSISEEMIYTKRAMSRPLTPPSDIETSKFDGQQSFSTEAKWSLADDRVLLEHVLTNELKQWTEVERKLQQKYTTAMCVDRWECLKTKILDTYAPLSACHSVTRM